MRALLDRFSRCSKQHQPLPAIGYRVKDAQLYSFWSITLPVPLCYPIPSEETKWIKAKSCRPCQWRTCTVSRINRVPSTAALRPGTGILLVMLLSTRSPSFKPFRAVESVLVWPQGDEILSSCIASHDFDEVLSSCFILRRIGMELTVEAGGSTDRNWDGVIALLQRCAVPLCFEYFQASRFSRS